MTNDEFQYETIIAEAIYSTDFCLELFPYLARFKITPAYQQELEVVRANLLDYFRRAESNTVVSLLEGTLCLLLIAVRALRKAGSPKTADDVRRRVREIERNLDSLRSAEI